MPLYVAEFKVRYNNRFDGDIFGGKKVLRPELFAAQSLPFLLAFVVWITWGLRTHWSFSTPSEAEKNRANDGKPENADRGPAPKPPERPGHKANYWASTKKYCKDNIVKFRDGVERSDKAIIAISTIVIAAFTVLLFIANILLYLSGEKTANAAQTSATAALKQAQAAQFQAYALRANFRFEQIAPHPFDRTGNPINSPGKNIFGWQLNPVWHNIGGTDARNVIGYWRIVPAPFVPFDQAKCPPLEFNNRRPEGVSISPGQILIQFAQILPAADAQRASGPTPTEVLFALGHLEYNDIFPDTPIHTVDWCFILAPNDMANSVFSDIDVYMRAN